MVRGDRLFVSLVKLSCEMRCCKRGMREDRPLSFIELLKDNELAPEINESGGGVVKKACN